MAAERVKRLKDLVEMVMRLPESPERDRLLSEVRSRAVDLDTGVTPRAMLPVSEPALAAMPKRRAAALPRRAPSPPPSPRDWQSDWETVIRDAPHLSLDDSPVAPPPGHVPPWTLGLRG